MFNKKRYIFIILSLLVFKNLKAQQKWDAPNTSNIILPEYFADPSIFYDEKSDSFYLYATTDGVWISYSLEPHVAVSKDLIHWEFQPIVLPDYYPLCTPEKRNSEGAGVWAPLYSGIRQTESIIWPIRSISAFM